MSGSPVLCTLFVSLLQAKVLVHGSFWPPSFQLPARGHCIKTAQFIAHLSRSLFMGEARELSEYRVPFLERSGRPSQRSYPREGGDRTQRKKIGEGPSSSSSLLLPEKFGFQGKGEKDDVKEEEGVSTSFPRIQKYARDLRSEEAIIGGNIVRKCRKLQKIL